MNASKMMKCLVSLGMIVSASSVFCAENTVKTPGFEEVSGGRAVGWNIKGAESEDNPVAIDDSIAHTGKNSMRITHKNPVYSKFSENIDVKPNTDYEASMWIKLDNVIVAEKGLGVKLYLGQGSDPWKTIKASPMCNGTCDWTKVSFTFNSGVNSKVQFIAYLHNSSGKAWFDDFELVEAQTAASKAK